MGLSQVSEPPFESAFIRDHDMTAVHGDLVEGSSIGADATFPMPHDEGNPSSAERMNIYVNLFVAMHRRQGNGAVQVNTGVEH